MKKTRKVTLETTETVGDYRELRQEMVEDLVHIEMSAPTPDMLSHYEELLFEMFRNMGDEDLQAHHDKHIEYFEQKEMKVVLEEYADKLRAEGEDVQTMILSEEDVEDLMRDE